MSEQLIQLEDLQTQLHEANQELARAARPLERLSEMKEAERQQLAAIIRAGLARWEAVTREISQVLRSGNGSGVRGARGESNES
jgi:flagellar biosynthesis chaperone FliJ